MFYQKNVLKNVLQNFSWRQTRQCGSFLFYLNFLYFCVSPSFQFLLVKEKKCFFCLRDWGKEKLSHGTVLNFCEMRREFVLQFNIYSSSLVSVWRVEKCGKNAKMGIEAFHTKDLCVYRQRQWKYFLFSLSFAQPAIIYYLYRCFLLDFLLIVMLL